MRIQDNEIRYLYDKNGNILAEKNGNAIVSVYIYGKGLEAFKHQGSVFRYVKNAHGDVLFIYTDTVGVNSYDYDAYCNVIDCSETVYNPIRYAGYYYDADTENYYLKNRYYDSSDARFLTEDPYWNVNNMLYTINQCSKYC